MDSKKGFWASFLNFIVQPDSLFAVIATSLLLLCCNALPLSVQKNIGFYAFLIKYNSWISVVFLISFFLFIYRLASFMFIHIREKRMYSFRYDAVRKLVYVDDCWRVLLKLYKADGVPLKFSYSEGGVSVLEESGLIIKLSYTRFNKDNSDYPHHVLRHFPDCFLFILSDVAKYYIKERLDKESRQGMDVENN